jgi:hypothetical protein
LPRPSRQTPQEAFCANMEDAYHLVRLAEAFTNQRVRKARREFRQRVGKAMKVPSRHWDELDCVESADVLVVLKPGAELGRDHFSDHKPLLRQALVAACAATETYLADAAMAQMSSLTTSADVATRRLKDMPMTVGDWLELERRYKYRRRGLHEQVIRRQVEELASTDPTKVGHLFSLLGTSDWTRKMDHHRGSAKGETFAFLDRVTKRRNKIVHTGDRQGLGRAPITVAEVKADLAALESVVAATEKLIAESRKKPR